MINNFSFTKEELKRYITQFYDYFSDGYKFEEFLKVYLEKLGFVEVVVTQRSRDGGIDLTASRPSIGMFGTEDYFIQAKLYNPNSSVSPEKIRALRGSMNYGKGVFITTARISDHAKEEALNFDLSKPIIAIDGEGLILSCIDLGIGFSYKPVFSKSAMDLLMDTNTPTSVSDISDSDTVSDIVEKEITANDIRARIISIPKFIMSKTSPNLLEIDVSVNGDVPIKLSITRGRNYLAKVTALFKQYGLIDENNAIIPRKARWRIDTSKQIIYINLI